MKEPVGQEHGTDEDQANRKTIESHGVWVRFAWPRIGILQSIARNCIDRSSLILIRAIGRGAKGRRRAPATRAGAKPLNKPGGVEEWSIAADLKSAELQGSGGSAKAARPSRQCLEALDR